MKSIIETDPLSFELYEMFKGDFPLAGFMEDKPEYLTVLVDSDEVVAMICSTVMQTVGAKRWLVPVWAAKKGYTPYLVEHAIKAINRHRKGDILITQIMTRHPVFRTNYRGAKILAHKLGFVKIDSNDICDIMQLKR